MHANKPEFILNYVRVFIQLANFGKIYVLTCALLDFEII